MVNANNFTELFHKDTSTHSNYSYHRLSPSFDDINSMRAPPTPGSISHSSSYNLNDSINDSFVGSQMPQASQQHRNTDSYKNYYQYGDGTGTGGDGGGGGSVITGSDYAVASGTMAGSYSDQVTYQSSGQKYGQSTKTTTNTVSDSVDVPPIMSNSNLTNVVNCNSRASSYVVSIVQCKGIALLLAPGQTTVKSASQINSRHLSSTIQYMFLSLAWHTNQPNKWTPFL